ncbi:putative signal peptide protein [Puccinia sorghi]|uniref:Putative signal peptide protein n=1 Tax=Puccinia sorghi TaxID=27349 RepID=A0A0L6UTA8_9BASI|nr:putative signal peptide protein [Puccinia sorghi]
MLEIFLLSTAVMKSIVTAFHQVKFFIIHSDTCTRFFSAIPIKSKSDVAKTIAQAPVRNRVSYLILPEKQHAKLELKGLLGTLIGYNDELQS